MLIHFVKKARGRGLWLVLMAAAALVLAPFACSDKDDSGDDGGNGEKDGSGGTDLGIPICDEMTIVASAIPPNLMLIVDTSGSMNDPTASGSNRTKLQDTRDALNHLLNEGEGSIRFCWVHFPQNPTAENHCGDAPYVEVDCSAVLDEIRQRVNGLGALGGTPTGAALLAAYAYQILHDETRGNYAVLLTDGLPTCPEGEGDVENEADNQLALVAMGNLHARGVDCFVIGLGEDLNSSNPDLLNQMAQAGGRPRSGAVKYYQANSMDELQLVLQEIQGAVLDCTLTLDSVPEYPDYLWMMFDDLKIDRDPDHVNGWDYDPGTNQILVYGPACDQLRAGNVLKIDVKMGCSPPD